MLARQNDDRVCLRERAAGGAVQDEITGHTEHYIRTDYRRNYYKGKPS
jgi:hypothetical protein